MGDLDAPPATPAASDTVSGIIEIAIQSEMETGTDIVRAVTPGRQQFHPSASKCWGYATVSGGVPTLAASFNITSITDSGVGVITFTIATDFSSADWAASIATKQGGAIIFNYIDSTAAGSIVITCISFASGTVSDPGAWSFIGFGDQA